MGGRYVWDRLPGKVVGGMKDCAMLIARVSMLASEKRGCWEWAGHMPGVFGDRGCPAGWARVRFSACISLG